MFYLAICHINVLLSYATFQRFTACTIIYLFICHIDVLAIGHFNVLLSYSTFQRFTACTITYWLICTFQCLFSYWAFQCFTAIKCFNDLLAISMFYWFTCHFNVFWAIGHFNVLLQYNDLPIYLPSQYFTQTFPSTKLPLLIAMSSFYLSYWQLQFWTVQRVQIMNCPKYDVWFHFKTA